MDIYKLHHVAHSLNHRKASQVTFWLLTGLLDFWCSKACQFGPKLICN